MTSGQTAPFFSIITPVHNRSNLIGSVIESVLKQSFLDFELVIVDDGSTDNTREVVSRYLNDRRIRYIFQVNSERAAARNTGARAASGNFLNFFDSDDIMYPNHLDTAYSFIQTCKPSFFHTGYKIVDETGTVLTEQVGGGGAAELIKTNYLGCDCVFVERSFFLENMFNPDRRLASSEDWELWLRLVSRRQLLSCDTVTLEMRNHPGRSLFTISVERVVERDMTLLQYLKQDRPFIEKFAPYLQIFEAERYTFFALLLSISGKRMSTLHFLGKALLATPRILATRRFWAGCKHLVLGLFKT